MQSFVIQKQRIIIIVIHKRWDIFYYIYVYAVKVPFFGDIEETSRGCSYDGTFFGGFRDGVTVAQCVDGNIALFGSKLCACATDLCNSAQKAAKVSLFELFIHVIVSVTVLHF